MSASGRALHLITVGGHRWCSPPERQEVDFPVARGLADRLGGEHHVVGRSVPGDDGGDDRTGNVVVHRLAGAESAWSFARRSRALVAELASRLGPDVVVTTSDPAGALAMRRPPARVPVVVQVQGSVLDPGLEYGSPLKRRIMRATMRRAVRNADGVRALNRFIAEQAEAAGAPGPIAVIGSRVDVELFSPGAGAAPHPPRIGAFGGLLPVNNQRVLVEALAQIGGDHPDAELVLVGDGPLRAALVARADELGVRPRLTLAGSIPHGDVPDLLRGLTVFAQPSYSEGEPRALLEAQAVGIPAVVSDIPAHRGIVADGETALIVPADDSAAWAKAFCRLLEDHAYAAELGAAGRARVRAEHEFGALLDRFAGFLRDTALARSVGVA